MEQSEHINYWLKSAEHDLATAETLFQHQRDDWSLFIGHLVIEKVLKAIIEIHPFRPEDFSVANPFVKEIMGTGIRVY